MHMHIAHASTSGTWYLKKFLTVAKTWVETAFDFKHFTKYQNWIDINALFHSEMYLSYKRKQQQLLFSPLRKYE